MKEVADFLRAIPTPRRECTYTKAQAAELYREHRKQILSDLKIREVQRRVASKLLGRDEDDPDPLFPKGHDVWTTSEDVPIGNDHLSDRSEAGPGISDAQLHNTQSSRPSEGLETSDAKSMSAGSRPRGAGRFIDLEADVSGDEETSGEDEDVSGDLSFIAPSDEEDEAPTEKHNGDMLRINDDVLRRLERRFAPRRRQGFFDPDRGQEAEHSCSDSQPEDEDSSLSEGTAEDISEGFVFPKQDMEYPVEPRPSFDVVSEVKFANDPDVAERKLGERRKRWCFDDDK